MKILFIGPRPDLANKHPGGQSTAALGLLDYCNKHGVDLDVVDSAQESFPYPKLSERAVRATRRIFSCIFMLSRKRYSGVIIFSSAGFSFYEKSMIALICRIFYTPSLLFIRSGFFFDQFNNRCMQIVASYLLKIPDFVGSQGSNWNRFYKQLNVADSKIITVPNWLSPAKSARFKFREHKQSTQDLRILFVGWLVAAKGVHDLVDAVDRSKILQRQQVVFVGDGDARLEIEGRLAREKFSKVTLTGWKNSSEVEREMYASDIFVLPSHAEGFPNVVVEALAAGLPIVATNVGAIGDSVRNRINGYVVDVGDVDGLARSLEELVLDWEFRAKCARNSSSIFLERHDREENCKRLLDIFRSNCKVKKS